jgi:hypothetical protein
VTVRVIDVVLLFGGVKSTEFRELGSGLGMVALRLAVVSLIRGRTGSVALCFSRPNSELAAPFALSRLSGLRRILGDPADS